MPSNDTTLNAYRQSPGRHAEPYSPDCSVKPSATEHETRDVLELIASICSFAEQVHPEAWRAFSDAAVHLMDGVGQHDNEMIFASAQYDDTP